MKKEHRSGHWKRKGRGKQEKGVEQFRSKPFRPLRLLKALMQLMASEIVGSNVKVGKSNVRRNE